MSAAEAGDLPDQMRVKRMECLEFAQSVQSVQYSWNFLQHFVTLLAASRLHSWYCMKVNFAKCI